MAIDGKLLARARGVLEEKRTKRATEVARRIEEVYAKSPIVRELDIQLRATMSDILGVALGAVTASSIEDIRKKNNELQKKQRSELVKAGFAENYLAHDYMCSACNDTGYIKSQMCDCLNSLYKAEQIASLSCLLKLGDETFDSFNLSFYSETPAPDTGISPCQYMEHVYDYCVEYARKFNEKSSNLFFRGATGLGKTFLSACIARDVADKGFSVVYDTAGSLFTKFEDAKFSKADSPEENRDEIKRYMECDLLIIDDLGTELTTAFTVSVLYDIINTRLCTARRTLVNSNLTISEMNRRYSEQIMSRLEGEYQMLTFYGDDIRKLKGG